MTIFTRYLLIIALLFALIEASAAERVAFVVGVDGYDHLPQEAQLQVAVDDATAIAETLRGVTPPFDVTLLTDVSHEEIENAFDQFLDETSEAECALFYFAGHGVEYFGTNYLIVKDTRIDVESDEIARMKRRLGNEALSLQAIVDSLDTIDAKVKLVVLDCCRDNPLTAKESGGTRSVLGGRSGLAQTTPPSGTLISYSADVGQRANDGLFTSVLVDEIQNSGLSILQVFASTREKVRRISAEWATEDATKGLPREFRRVLHEPAEYNKLSLSALDFKFNQSASGREESTVETTGVELLALQKQVESLKKMVTELKANGIENSGLRKQLEEMERNFAVAESKQGKDVIDTGNSDQLSASDKDKLLKIGLVDMQGCLNDFWKTKREVEKINALADGKRNELDALRAEYDGMTSRMHKLDTNVRDSSLPEITRRADLDILKILAGERTAKSQEINREQQQAQTEILKARQVLEARLVADLRAVVSEESSRESYDLIFDRSFLPKANKWIPYFSDKTPDLTASIIANANRDDPEKSIEISPGRPVPIGGKGLRIGMIDMQKCLNDYWRTDAEVEKVNALAALRASEREGRDKSIALMEERSAALDTTVKNTSLNQTERQSAMDSLEALTKELSTSRNERENFVSKTNEEILSARNKMEVNLVSEIKDSLTRRAGDLNFDLVFDRSFLPKASKVLVHISESAPDLTRIVSSELNSARTEGGIISVPENFDLDSGYGLRIGVIDVQSCLNQYWKTAEETDRLTKQFANQVEGDREADNSEFIEAKKKMEEQLAAEISEAASSEARALGFDLVIDLSYLPGTTKAILEFSEGVPDLSPLVTKRLNSSRPN